MMFAHRSTSHCLVILAIYYSWVLVLVSSLAHQVSVCSWNLLAPRYAKENKYPWSNAQDLDWKNRQSRIVQILASIDADIVCLQEVQVDLWHDLLSKLQQRGYHGVLQKMGGQHPVANAILIRQHGLHVVRTESRSRALIAVIMDKEEQSSPLYLANVHLDAGWTRDSDETRFNQVKSLCKRLQHQIAKDSKVSTEEATIVIAGDCNMLRESRLYKLLSTGSTSDPQGNKITAPLLPLHDTHLNQSPPWGPNIQMSYRSGHLLDYVWVSDTVDVLRTMPDMLGTVATAEPKAWPCATHPSDHIPIGAILSWPGAPHVVNDSERTGWQQLDDYLDPWTVSPRRNKVRDETDERHS